MAVLHVFAQADVRDDQQFRQFLFQQPHGLLDDAVFGVSAGSLRVLFVGNAEQQNGGNAERMGARRLAHDFIRRQLADAGHGLDGAAQLPPGAGEQRQDELLRRSSAFRTRAAATRATAAAGAGDIREIRAKSWAQFRFCEARAKGESECRAKRQSNLNFRTPLQLSEAPKSVYLQIALEAPQVFELIAPITTWLALSHIGDVLKN